MIRIFDIVLSCIALLVLSPPLLVVAVILRCTGEHDVFFKQLRIGRGGKPFYIVKFATMLRDSPNLPGGLITLANDPRLLPLGKLLRLTKINELPQLLNILAGQMSIVGYRPFAEAHYNLYSNEVKAKLSKLSPGLTGVGSIIFKNEEEILHSVEDREYLHDKVITPYKGLLECWYVEHHCLANYLILICLTALSFFRPSSRLVFKIFKDLPPIPSELVPYICTGAIA